jgi:ESF2/ABP1 family protein
MAPKKPQHEEPDSEEEIESGSEPEQEEKEADEDKSDNENEPDDEEVDADGNNNPVLAVKPKKVHKLSLAKTEDFNERLRKRGVLYIARIPPRMTPTKVKSLLSEFGEVTRVYLVEEDPTVRKRRKKVNGGSGGKRYIEGWVEFASKKIAKHVAASLNTTPITNQKRNPHYGKNIYSNCIVLYCSISISLTSFFLHFALLSFKKGDLWNIKYLPKFKWSHLTEKVAYERRVREQKLRVEMMQARRENASYVQMVETGKKLDQIEVRKRRRGEEGDVVASRKGDKTEKRQKHRQTKPLKEGSDKAAKRALLGGLV